MSKLIRKPETDTPQTQDIHQALWKQNLARASLSHGSKLSRFLIFYCAQCSQCRSLRIGQSLCASDIHPFIWPFTSARSDAFTRSRIPELHGAVIAAAQKDIASRAEG